MFAKLLTLMFCEVKETQVSEIEFLPKFSEVCPEFDQFFTCNRIF